MKETNRITIYQKAAEVALPVAVPTLSYYLLAEVALIQFQQAMILSVLAMIAVLLAILILRLPIVRPQTNNEKDRRIDEMKHEVHQLHNELRMIEKIQYDLKYEIENPKKNQKILPAEYSIYLSYKSLGVLQLSELLKEINELYLLIYVLSNPDLNKNYSSLYQVVQAGKKIQKSFPEDILSITSSETGNSITIRLGPKWVFHYKDYDLTIEIPKGVFVIVVSMTLLSRSLEVGNTERLKYYETERAKVEIRNKELESKKIESGLETDELERQKLQLEIEKGELEKKKLEQDIRKGDLETKKLQLETEKIKEELKTILKTHKLDKNIVSDLESLDSMINSISALDSVKQKWIRKKIDDIIQATQANDNIEAFTIEIAANRR